MRRTRSSQQRLHGAGHGQVGLAGARRSDAEVDVAVLDAAHVALLIPAAGLDGAALGADDLDGLDAAARRHAIRP
jgi:hypothetical protein